LATSGNSAKGVNQKVKSPALARLVLRSSVLALGFQGKHSVRSRFGSEGRLVEGDYWDCRGRSQSVGLALSLEEKFKSDPEKVVYKTGQFNSAGFWVATRLLQSQ
jgi:hypothetical protein